MNSFVDISQVSLFQNLVYCHQTAKYLLLLIICYFLFVIVIHFTMMIWAANKKLVCFKIVTTNSHRIS